MSDDILNTLQALIQTRKDTPTAGSYTNSLFDAGRAKIAQKVGEEAVEVVVAALAQDAERQISEAADLMYHLLVLLADLGLSLDDVRAELVKRHGK
ncbi:MAG: phosphoribosyl-ATP diphosphatase [Anaerolineae bacterium]|jgi:phosphoribosyl-ATP pyrophosphohydrolase|nr:phosphoribosyl-ATP diphosphatase [Anaerolineae bacterium]